jgi:hypothetical protein
MELKIYRIRYYYPALFDKIFVRYEISISKNRALQQFRVFDFPYKKIINAAFITRKQYVKEYLGIN